MKPITLHCIACGAPAAPTAWRCDACGRTDTLEIVNLPPFDAAAIDPGVFSLWRYAAMLPFERRVSLGEGLTPLVDVTLNGEPFRAKLDFLQPTSSYKDRGTVGVINQLAAHGVRDVVETSSGNAGASVAGYAAAAGMRARIFVPEGAPEAKRRMIAAYGAEVVPVVGSKADVMAATEAAITGETAFASHSHSPFFMAGMMTLAWELWEQHGRRAPDAVVTPVGMAMLLLGMVRGFRALQTAGLIERLPRFFAVQSEHSDPVVRAWDAGLDHVPPIHDVKKTVADGIVIPAPLRGAEIMQALRDSDGAGVRVREDSIIPARDALARVGIYAEPTSATTYAALPQVREIVGAGADVVLILTGNGLKSPV